MATGLISLSIGWSAEFIGFAVGVHAGAPATVIKPTVGSRRLAAIGICEVQQQSLYLWARFHVLSINKRDIQDGADALNFVAGALCNFRLIVVIDKPAFSKSTV